MTFKWFLTSGQLKIDMIDAFMKILASGQLKTDFSHPLWYDLAVVDRLA